MTAINSCRYCGSSNLGFFETPTLIHHGKYVCKHCGKFCAWVRNPILPKNNRTSHKSIKEICKFHQIKGEAICFFCLRKKEQLGTKETLTIDHIQELNKGGDDALYNMQILCSACHKLKNWLRLYLNWHLNGGEDGENT